jgi:hypothetical protein
MKFLLALTAVTALAVGCGQSSNSPAPAKPAATTPQSNVGIQGTGLADVAQTSDSFDSTADNAAPGALAAQQQAGVNPSDAHSDLTPLEAQLLTYQRQLHKSVEANRSTVDLPDDFFMTAGGTALTYVVAKDMLKRTDRFGNYLPNYKRAADGTPLEGTPVVVKEGAAVGSSAGSVAAPRTTKLARTLRVSDRTASYVGETGKFIGKTGEIALVGVLGIMTAEKAIKTWNGVRVYFGSTDEIKQQEKLVDETQAKIDAIKANLAATYYPEAKSAP